MGTPYDILIDIRARAQEVATATAAITELVKQAEATGPALVAGVQKGDAATRTLAGSLRDTAAAAGETAKQGSAAGAAVAAGMDKAAQSAKGAGGIIKELGEDAAKAWSNFGSKLGEDLLSGITMGFGTGIAEKVVEGIGEIPKLFTEAIEKGVEFNREMESLGISLAASLRQSAPEKYLNFAQAQQDAARAIDLIAQKTNALGLDFKSVGETLSVSMKALADGGIRDLNQQIEVTTLLMTAAAAKNTSGTQAVRDILDILNGQGDRVKLSKELGISNEDIKSAEEAGTLYDLLTSKLAAYKEAGAAAANTFNGLWTTVQSLFAQLEGSAATPVFDTLKSGLAELKTILDSIQARGAAQGTADFLSDLIHGAQTALPALKATLNAIIDQNEALAALKATAAGYYDQGLLTAYQQANDRILDSIRNQVLAAADDAQKAAARQKLDDAILATQKEISTAQGVQKAAADNLLDALTQIRNSFGIVAGSAHEAADASGGMTHALGESNAELDKMLAKLPAIVGELRQAAEAADLAQRLAAAIGPAAKLGEYQAQQVKLLQKANDLAQQAGGHAGIQSSLGAEGEFGVISNGKLAQTKEQADAAMELSRVVGQLRQAEAGITTEQRNQTTETEKQNAEEMKRRLLHAESTATNKEELQTREDAAKVFARERELMNGADHMDPAKAHETALQEIADQRQVAALKKKFNAEDRAGKKATGDASRAEHQEQLAADKDRKTALLEIRDQIQEIQKDPYQTDDQKQQGMKPLLEQELALLKENIRERDELIKRYASDPKHAGEVANLKRENVQDQHQETTAGNQLKGMTFGGQMQGELTKLQNEFTVSGTTIGEALSKGITTGTSAVSSALTGLITQTGNWKESFVNAGRAMVGQLVDMGVKFVAHYVLIGAQMLAHSVLGSTLKAKDTAETISNNSEKAASSATAGLLESITSYGIAAAVGAAAFLAAMALSGGFAEGGLIPGRSSRSDNRIANVATGEFIHQSKAVDYYGVPAMHALNQMRVPRADMMALLSGMQVSRPSFATGGLVGGGDSYAPIFATGSPNVRVNGHNLTVIQTNNRNELLQAMESSEGRKIVLGHVRGNRTQVGIRS